MKTTLKLNDAEIKKALRVARTNKAYETKRAAAAIRIKKALDAAVKAGFTLNMYHSGEVELGMGGKWRDAFDKAEA